MQVESREITLERKESTTQGTGHHSLVLGVELTARAGLEGEDKV